MMKINYEQTSYILSIVALVLAFFQPFAGLVLGIVGLVQAKRAKGEIALKAKRYSIIAIIVSVVILIAYVVVSIFSSLGYLSSIYSY
jgi:hypothetical protein